MNCVALQMDDEGCDVQMIQIPTYSELYSIAVAGVST
jgi:hypothetical protein